MTRSALLCLLTSCASSPPAHVVLRPDQEIVLPAPVISRAPTYAPFGLAFDEDLIVSTRGMLAPWESACAVTPSPGCERTTQRRQGGVEERWTQESEGLHHTFVLADPVRAPQELTLELRGLEARQLGVDGVELVGRRTFRYTGLQVTDATGAVLPSALKAAGDAVVLAFDATGSVGEILVDPLLTEPNGGDVRNEDIGFVSGPSYGYLPVASGDNNGDGYEDIVTNDYSIWIPGGEAGLDVAGAWVFGWGTKAGGLDANGDGLDDILRHSHTLQCSNLIVGVEGGHPAEEPCFAFPTSSRYSFDGVAMGDFNGDGFGDLVVGNRYPLGVGLQSYSFSVIAGGPNVLAETYLPVDTSQIPTDPRCTGWDDFSSVGDVNGDGFDDLLFGVVPLTLVEDAPLDGWLYFGGPAGPGPSHRWAWALARVDGFRDEVSSLEIAGDLNGDGYDDLIASGENRFWWVPGGGQMMDPFEVAEHGGYHVGRAVCIDRRDDFSLKAYGINDVNGDGYDDVAVISADGTYLHLGSPDGPSPAAYGLADHADQFGNTEYANGAGDVNGDGYGDWVVTLHGVNQVVQVYLGAPTPDTDLDGTPNELDCDPWDPRVAPGMPEVAGNRKDDDCDGTWTCFEDVDGDGYGDTPITEAIPGCDRAGRFAQADDCDSSRADVNPGQPDVVDDGVDDDCDGDQACLVDLDGDGFGTATDVASCLDHPSRVPDGTDCDDTRAETSPTAPEVPGNGHDDDCDGLVTCLEDRDRDGFGDPAVPIPAPGDSCALPGLADGEDCDDDDRQIYPGAREVTADSIDQDCDGLLQCWKDEDLDGYGTPTRTVNAVSCGDLGASENTLDCHDLDPNQNPEGIDLPTTGDNEDCWGTRNGWQDRDGDGYAALGAPLIHQEGGAPAVAFIDPAVESDCDDLNRDIFPHQRERLHNDIDEDCDGFDVCYRDLDGDGFGWCRDTYFIDPRYTSAVHRESAYLDECDDLSTLVAVRPGRCGREGTTDEEGDCDDTRPEINPGRGTVDVPGNWIDENCNHAYRVFRDEDGDSYGEYTWVDRFTESSLVPAFAGSLDACEWGCEWVPRAGDCDPANPGVHPDAMEIPGNGIDEDCDGVDGLTVTAAWLAGDRVWVRLRGAPPNQPVWVDRSDAPSVGCLAPCRELLADETRSARTGVDGRASWYFQLPPGIGRGTKMWFQVGGDRGGFSEVVEVIAR